MKHYLVKIEFDTNDSDYVYGLNVINEYEKEIIDRNRNKAVSFGCSDWGGNECRLGDCIFVTEITEKEYKVLEKLGLLNFGEGGFGEWIAQLDVAPVYNGEDGEEDEDEEDDEEE